MIVLGYPSSKNPFFLTYSVERASLTISFVISSGTYSPDANIDFTFRPNSVSFLIFSLNISPVEICLIPLPYSTLEAIVPLPTPGAPKNI